MPDMRLPIGLALGAPRRLDEAFGPVDWTTLRALDFEEPDRATFRALDLAYGAGRAGGAAPAVLSGANEVAVEAFLERRLPWTGIDEVVDEVLQAGTGAADEVEDVLEADRRARERARQVVARRSTE
jgi:1-deoxy-D-xylulose-5-phosphate reductoisomerase